MMMTDHHTRGLKTRRLKIGFAVLIVAALAGCGGADVEYSYPRSGAGGVPTYEKKESVFGEGGLTLFENQGAAAQTSGGGGGIGVNSFLWRASLDTLSFISKKDSFHNIAFFRSATGESSAHQEYHT